MTGPAESAGRSRLQGQLLGAGLALHEALGRVTHGYEPPPGGSTGCERLVPPDEAVLPGQVCGLPVGHGVHQTPGVVLGYERVHACTELADVFGGWLCTCGESWSELHAGGA